MGLLKALGLPDAVPAGPAKPAPLSAGPSANAGPPKPAAHPDKDFKAVSWATPSPSVSTSPVHVASIYFATRDWSVGSKEEALLRGLAKAYAPYARRGWFTKGGEAGVQGSVVGHADPRRSREPDNVALARNRAMIVARRLVRNLAGESGVIEGQFDISFEGAPVPAAVEDDAAIETDAYAPMRRADVFLVGGVMEEASPPPGEPDPDEIPPPMEDLEHEWHKFDAGLERIDREEIRVMAILMNSALGVGVSASGPRGGNMSASGAVGAIWTAISLEIDLHHRARRSHLPSVLTPTKPSWWDGLDAGSGTSQGRNPKRNALAAKSRRLMTWYLTTIRYGATYVDGPGGASKRAFDEIRKDNPDEAKMRVYARTVEQYLYMIQATVDLAQEVMKLAE